MTPYRSLTIPPQKILCVNNPRENALQKIDGETNRMIHNMTLQTSWVMFAGFLLFGDGGGIRCTGDVAGVSGPFNRSSPTIVQKNAATNQMIPTLKIVTKKKRVHERYFPFSFFAHCCLPAVFPEVGAAVTAHSVAQPVSCTPYVYDASGKIVEAQPQDLVRHVMLKKTSWSMWFFIPLNSRELGRVQRTEHYVAKNTGQRHGECNGYRAEL